MLRRSDIFLHLGLSFLLPLAAYWYGLAPSVTFEDSGELITAAYHFGVPHPPGYPLYTLLAGLWLKLSWVEPARALNFFSAVLSSMASVFLFLSARQLNRSLLSLPPRTSSWIALVTAVAVSLAPHYFRQSVIVEVYALNNLLSAILLYLMVRLVLPGRESAESHDFHRRVGLSAFVLGLAVTAHQTSLVFAPCLLLAIWIAEPAYLKSFKHWGRGFIYLMLGLLPYLYLPLRAAADPVLNWGRADSWQGFWRLITRQQYNPQLSRPATVLLEQLREQIILLVHQFPLTFLFLGLWALTLLFGSRRRSLFWLLLSLVVMTGPVVAVLANFHFPLNLPDAYLDLAHLHSVFYLPHYQVWALLFALGLGQLLHSLAPSRYRMIRALVVGAVLLRLAVYGFHTVKTESKRGYDFPRRHFTNLQTLAAGGPALVLVNWDPFSFPAFYYQRVLHQADNLLFVDLELFKADWYLHYLRKHHSDFSVLYSKPMEELTDQRRKFLANDPSYDVRKFLQAYVDASNAMIEYAKNQGWRVFLVVYRRFSGLLPGVTEGYIAEPRLVAAELKRPGEKLPPLPGLNDFSLPEFHPPRFQSDRLARMLNFYYSEIFIETAEKWLQNGQSDRADEALEVVRQWNAEDPRLKERAARALRQIEKTNERSGD